MAKEEEKAEDYTFGWEEVAEVADFLKDEEAEVTDVEDKENIDDKIENEKSPEDKEAEEVSAKMFAEDVLDTPETKDTEDKDTPSKLATVADIALVQTLKERGLLDYELEEDAVMTKELAAEILEDSYDDRVSDEVEKMLEGMPEEAKNLNRYLLNGGTVGNYIKGLKSNVVEGVSKGMDMTEVKNQEAVVRNKLSNKGFDADYIAAELEHLKDSGRLEATSGVYFKKWETKFGEEETKLAQSQAKQKEQAKEDRRAQKQSVTSFINEAKDIQGVSITKADKKILPNYMTEKITLESGQTMTQMHNDLYAALNDSKKSVLLAKLLQNGFDFKSIKESAVTDKTKNVKNKLRRNKDNTPSGTTGTGSRKLTLAERLTQ